MARPIVHHKRMKAQFIAHELNCMRYGRDYAEKAQEIYDWIYDLVNADQWTTLSEFIGSWYANYHHIEEAWETWERISNASPLTLSEEDTARVESFNAYLQNNN